MQGHIFVSYARADQAYVVRLADHLEGAGLRVWFDYQLAAGEHFDEEIRRQIVTSAAVIVVMTPDSIDSKWVAREVACADEAGVPLVPLVLKACPTPIRLQALHREDVTSGRMPILPAIERLKVLCQSSDPARIPDEANSTRLHASQEATDDDARTGAMPTAESPIVGDFYVGLIRAISGHVGQVRGLAFSPDGSLLASGGRDRSIRILETNTWSLVKHIQGENDPSWPLAFLPGTHTLAAATYGCGGVDLIDVLSGARLGRLAAEHENIMSIGFSADGTILATGGTDRTTRLWATADGSRLGRLTAGRAVPGWPLAFAPAGTKIAVAHYGGPTAGIWDTATLRLVRGLARHTDYVTAVSFTPDGATVATGSDDTTVRLWDTNSGALKRTLRGHTRRVLSVSFGTGSCTLASAGTDRKIRLWHAGTGEIVRTLPGPVGGIYALAHSPDGQFLASAGGDGHVRIWAVGGLELA